MVTEEVVPSCLSDHYKIIPVSYSVTQLPVTQKKISCQQLAPDCSRQEKKQKLVFTRVTIFLNNKIEGKFVNFEVFKLKLLIFDPFHLNHNDIITT